ncbi:hypothetical protein SAMN05192553_11176 [Cyclobacterium xiamenense]|uniref:Uncharacterized protein n=1 Tax=Cyclobacterium xiamenense TaxID=1297121 RepID=A0A1H7BDT7_9BACT|nr:hypothetical protein SAMN05192553_11176 [Cyclobacterium xiamenense]
MHGKAFIYPKDCRTAVAHTATNIPFSCAWNLPAKNDRMDPSHGFSNRGRCMQLKLALGTDPPAIGSLVQREPPKESVCRVLFFLSMAGTVALLVKNPPTASLGLGNPG